MSEAATHEAIEVIARNSYGRLIAFLRRVQAMPPERRTP